MNRIRHLQLLAMAKSVTVNRFFNMDYLMLIIIDCNAFLLSRRNIKKLTFMIQENRKEKFKPV